MSIWVWEFFKKPKWGEFNDKNKCILSFIFSNNGNVARTIIPPKECDINDILLN